MAFAECFLGGRLKGGASFLFECFVESFNRLGPYSAPIIAKSCAHGLFTHVVISHHVFNCNCFAHRSVTRSWPNSCCMLQHPVRKKKVDPYSNNWSRCIECGGSVPCSPCAKEHGQHIVYSACRGCAMGWLSRSHCMLQHADLKYQACIVDSNAP